MPKGYAIHKPNDKYNIVAQDRSSGLREVIAGPFSLETAITWNADSLLRKSHRYFKISKNKK